MNDLTNEKFLGLLTSLVLSQTEPLCLEEECEHRIKLGVNENMSICLCCKKRTEEKIGYALLLKGQ